MPHLETVAGEALARSPTSNSMCIVLLSSLMRSLLGKHRVRVSSNTCKEQRGEVLCYPNLPVDQGRCFINILTELVMQRSNRKVCGWEE